MTIKLYKGETLIAKNETPSKGWVTRYANRIKKELKLRVAREINTGSNRFIYLQSETGLWYQISVNNLR